jgi:hypothetical protein
MLNRFNSNNRKLNRVIKQINLNNLSESGYLDNLLEDYRLQSSLSSSFDGRDENGNPLPQEQAILELSASIAYNYNTSFDTTISTKFNSNTRSNPNPIRLVNNKNKISEFHNEILQHSARYVSRNIDTFSNLENTLTIFNVSLDYGTEGASADNFEVLVYGLHIPGNYSVTQNGNNVIVKLNDRYIDFDSVTANDIYVIGKLVDIPIAAENDIILSTENNLDLIV